MASISLPNSVRGLAVDEMAAYVVTFTEQKYWSDQYAKILNVIDIRHPEAPELKGMLPLLTSWYGEDMTAQAQFLFTVEYPNLDIFDAKNPEHPSQTGFFFFQGITTPFAIRGPWIYGRWDRNLRILFMDCLPGFTSPKMLFSGLQLHQNYPNPFNTSTAIMYTIFQPNLVEVDVFNILSQHVVTIERKARDMGYYMTKWDGKDGHGHPCAAGIYFCRVRAGEYTKVKKMVKLP